MLIYQGRGWVAPHIAVSNSVSNSLLIASHFPLVWILLPPPLTIPTLNGANTHTHTHTHTHTPRDCTKPAVVVRTGEPQAQFSFDTSPSGGRSYLFAEVVERAIQHSTACLLQFDFSTQDVDLFWFNFCNQPHRGKSHPVPVSDTCWPEPCVDIFTNLYPAAVRDRWISCWAPHPSRSLIFCNTKTARHSVMNRATRWKMSGRKGIEHTWNRAFPPKASSFFGSQHQSPSWSPCISPAMKYSCTIREMVLSHSRHDNLLRVAFVFVAHSRTLTRGMNGWKFTLCKPFLYKSVIEKMLSVSK